MLKFVLPGLAVLALCACGAEQNGVSRQLPPGRPTWSTTQTGDQSRLAYGLPQSDIVALAFDCSPHSGRLTVSGPVPLGASKLVLRSGATTDEIRGSAAPDPEDGLDLFTGAAGARDAVLAAFARTGRLVRIDAAGTVELSAAGPERAVVRLFLDRCAR